VEIGLDGSFSVCHLISTLVEQRVTKKGDELNVVEQQLERSHLRGAAPVTSFQRD
jgi:hypothetical protein